MKKTLDALVKTVGRGRLGLVHANDSKDPLGSARDRHEAIGEGHIGKDPFAELFRHPATRGVPVVVETPGDASTHRRDIELLSACATPSPLQLGPSPGAPGSSSAARARGRRGCGSRAPPRSRAGPREVLHAAHPLRALPGVQVRDHEAQRPAVLRASAARRCGGSRTAPARGEVVQRRLAL